MVPIYSLFGLLLYLSVKVFVCLFVFSEKWNSIYSSCHGILQGCMQKVVCFQLLKLTVLNNTSFELSSNNVSSTVETEFALRICQDSVLQGYNWPSQYSFW